MDLPVQITFFKKLELYQELKSRDARRGDDKAWMGEKDILRWAATEHRHLGTGIDWLFVKTNILTDLRYNNFPDDALRPMENLLQRGYVVGWPKIKFLKEGLLMGEVIDEVAQGRGWRYEFLYWFTWIAVICGVLLVIGPVVKFILFTVFHFAYFLSGSHSTRWYLR